MGPYIVATEEVRRHIDYESVEQRHDPRKMACAEFLDRLEVLDQQAYSADDLTMPRWAFYDCGELPGVVCGMAEGDVPISMVIAIPMLGERRWLIHSLCASDDDRDVARRSLDLAIEVLGPSAATISTQWRSWKLAVFAELAPLEVLAAWCPAHSITATCVLRFEPDRAQPPDGSQPLDIHDDAALLRLQHELQSGLTATLIGAPSPAGIASISRRR